MNCAITDRTMMLECTDQEQEQLEQLFPETF